MAFRWLCRRIVLQAKTYQKSGEVGIKVATNGIKKLDLSEAGYLT